jgi:Zn-dependent peptidase ImmA (M78 family)
MPLPVNPFALARDLGITVRFARLPADESGNIVMLPDETAVITLNSLDSLNRQRFTCAHEIGHYSRRRDEGETQYVDYRDTLAGLGSHPQEIFANQFGAALLMPAAEVKRYLDAGYTVEALAALFGTSVQAMELRLRNLRLR